jgi:hypothetical protein
MRKVIVSLFVLAAICMGMISMTNAADTATTTSAPTTAKVITK